MSNDHEFSDDDADHDEDNDHDEDDDHDEEMMTQEEVITGLKNRLKQREKELGKRDNALKVMYSRNTKQRTVTRIL